MGKMNRVGLLAAMVASSAPMSGAMVLRARDEPPMVSATSAFGTGFSVGKGKGRRPHHSSARFVAQDKRDARKARNRSR